MSFAGTSLRRRAAVRAVRAIASLVAILALALVSCASDDVEKVRPLTDEEQAAIEKRQFAEALSGAHPEPRRSTIPSAARHHDPVTGGFVHEQHRHEVEPERRFLETVGDGFADIGLRVGRGDRGAEAE